MIKMEEKIKTSRFLSRKSNLDGVQEPKDSKKVLDNPRKIHKVFIIAQIIFAVIVIVALFVLYPRAKLDLEGNIVNFNTINANVIILSANPDFSNPRYIDIENNVSFNLKPGRYYWKAGNGIIEGLSKEFEIKSEVGLSIIEKTKGKEIQNVGNVKVNVSRTADGSFVGHIILEPDESEQIGNESGFTGRQDD